MQPCHAGGHIPFLSTCGPPGYKQGQFINISLQLLKKFTNLLSQIC